VRVLFIGGTGFISMAVSRQAIDKGFELYLLNRGSQPNPAGSHSLTADIHKAEELRRVLQGLEFDVVVDWIAYGPDDINRDVALFKGRVKQYIFISSASVYQKPPAHYLITESTGLNNPYSEYARGKIACEERLMEAYREKGFPATIVRPSLTYDRNFPVAIGGRGCYTLAERLIRGREIIVHGDGSSLWVVTHADDFARGFLGLLGNTSSTGHAFHITSNEVLTWDHIYQTIAEALGVEAKIVHISSDFITQVAPQMTANLLGDKTWSTVFDNSKIKAFVPEFRIAVPFRDGIRRTVAWFASDERRRRIDEAVNREMDRILNIYSEKRC
jgi:nucleoside-diphosphate-sugar epimerase